MYFEHIYSQTPPNLLLLLTPHFMPPPFNNLPTPIFATYILLDEGPDTGVWLICQETFFLLLKPSAVCGYVHACEGAHGGQSIGPLDLEIGVAMCFSHMGARS